MCSLLCSPKTRSLCITTAFPRTSLPWRLTRVSLCGSAGSSCSSLDTPRSTPCTSSIDAQRVKNRIDNLGVVFSLFYVWEMFRLNQKLLCCSVRIHKTPIDCEKWRIKYKMESWENPFFRCFFQEDPWDFCISPFAGIFEMRVKINPISVMIFVSVVLPNLSRNPGRTPGRSEMSLAQQYMILISFFLHYNKSLFPGNRYHV